MKWKKIKTDETDVTYRHGHRAVAANGFIYLYGGGNHKICKQFHGYNIKENQNFLPKFRGERCPGVASFGMCIYDNTIIIFGGMIEYGHYSNVLYTLNISTFNWKKFGNAPMNSPSPRIGHSFTLSDDQKIYLFGGLINAHSNPRKHNIPKFMNDLYVLNIIEENRFKWQKLTVSGGPCARESHSAVFYNDSKAEKKYLIIFGGMNGCRLGDLWFLDLNQMIWMQFEVSGLPPTPRSLHSANLIDSKMYVFGGWVERQPQKSIMDPPCDRFETTNLLSYLDLDEMKWVHFENYDEPCPRARAGHSMTTVDKRLYLWGGRTNYSESDDDFIVAKDFWILETEKPQKISNITLIKATKSSLEIKWNEISNADYYFVEIHKIQAVPIDISKLRIKTSLVITSQKKSNEQNIEIGTKRKLEEQDDITEKMIIREVKEEPVTDENNNNEVNEVKPKSESPVKEKPFDIRKMWLTAGIFETNTCILDGYLNLSVDTTDLDSINCPQASDLSKNAKISLLPDTMYVFRVAALNLMGISEWSKLFYFKTTALDPPSAPNNCKFILTNQGLRLAWNPNPLSDKVLYYHVFIAIKKYVNPLKYDFLRVYEGLQPTCHVLKNIIDNAYHEIMGSKESVIFRLTAVNNSGTSSPLLTSYII